ncbi:MAG: hypothetical protein E6Q97_28720 [Desulfurellales bacterium]|nr:MAG: hypothetical protein E6Q97_28720 [Desulfurellales bacterium]
MSDLLTTLIPDVLTTEVERVVLLEAPDDADIFETVTESVLTEVSEGNELITTVTETHLLTEGLQGPPGPPGAGTGSGIEQSIYVDASRPIAYVAYANRIVRLDYATWPPVETTATTADVHSDWPNRATLGYA